MKLNDYKEQYNAAPYALEDFASGACDIEDADNIKDVAIAYLEAKKNFEQILENIGVELG